MLTDRTKKIATDYKCPVISGGDLNCNLTSEPISKLKEAGLMLIHDLATEKNDLRTHHAYPEFSKDHGYYSQFTAPTNEYKASIDHVFAYNSGNVKFERYHVITEDTALMTSDHCPIIVDFSFKN